MLTKKEKAGKMLELEKLDKAFKGVKLMKRTPDALFVVDSIYEKQAVKEAKTLGIPCYAISNTNGNPYDVQGCIPANTNSVKSLDYLAAAIKSGLKTPVKTAPAVKKAIEKKTTATKKTPIAKKTEEK